MPRAPWMKWNPADFLTDPRVIELAPTQELLYRRLLEQCWLGRGKLTRKPSLLKRFAHPDTAGSFAEDWKAVSRFFEPHPEDPERYLTNRRVYEDLAELDRVNRFRRRQRLAGQARARSADRAEDGRFLQPSQPRLGRLENHPAKPAERPATAGPAGLGNGWYQPDSSHIDSDSDSDSEREEKSTPPGPPQGGEASPGGEGVSGPAPRKKTRRVQIPGRTPGFEVFWRSYPRRVGKDAAARAYRTRLRQTLDAQEIPTAEWRRGDEILSEYLVGVVREQVKWPEGKGLNREDDRFIPHASTWLNEARFEDEPERRRL